MHYFHFSWKAIMWEMSYANLMMLSATVPSYKSKSGTNKEKPVESIAEGPEDLAKYLGL